MVPQQDHYIQHHITSSLLELQQHPVSYAMEKWLRLEDRDEESFEEFAARYADVVSTEDNEGLIHAANAVLHCVRIHVDLQSAPPTDIPEFATRLMTYVHDEVKNAPAGWKFAALSILSGMMAGGIRLENLVRAVQQQGQGLQPIGHGASGYSAFNRDQAMYFVVRSFLSWQASQMTTAPIEDYQKGQYIVHGSKPTTLTMGTPTDTIQGILNAKGATTAMIISAQNPFGFIIDAALNEFFDAALEFEAQEQQWDYQRVTGCDDEGVWVERSILVYDLTKDEAKQLGREYQQETIVWLNREGIRLESCWE